MEKRTLFSRSEMLQMNTERLEERGVKITEIAEIAYQQQSKWTDVISMKDCVDSVDKILSLRDTFHILQLGAEIDRLTETGEIKGPIRDILDADLGLFGIDELFGLELGGIYGTIGKTNFGDIDVNKPAVIERLNTAGKTGKKECHTFMDDIVGAIAAAASTRVAQIINEKEARKDPRYKEIKLDFDI